MVAGFTSRRGTRVKSFAFSRRVLNENDVFENQSRWSRNEALSHCWGGVVVGGAIP